MQFYQKRRENCVKTHVILKKASFYACLTLFAGMAFPMPLWASQSTAIVQQHVKQITGIVNDTSGAPVIGANVVEVGSTNGTITDVDGKFTLNVSVGAKLKVSLYRLQRPTNYRRQQQQLHHYLERRYRIFR